MFIVIVPIIVDSLFSNFILERRIKGLSFLNMLREYEETFIEKQKDAYI